MDHRPQCSMRRDRKSTMWAFSAAKIQKIYVMIPPAPAPDDPGAPHLARVVKLVDTGDLKSPDWKQSYRFDSGPGHQ